MDVHNTPYSVFENGEEKVSVWCLVGALSIQRGSTLIFPCQSHKNHIRGKDEG
jgi:hypothetical protein